MSALDITLLVIGVLGFAAVGSFTNVVIDRLPLALEEPNQYGELWDTRPWTEVFRGRSRCSACGEAVRPVDNIPIVSWLVLRGRCRSCGTRIPAFHIWVELLVPLLFVGAVVALGWGWQILPALWLIPVGVAVSVIDIRTLIVPTRIVWPSFFVSVALCVAVAAIEVEWEWLLAALIGLAVMAGPMFAIWFINPKGMGFGDVRLATLLGLNVGFYAGTVSAGSIGAPVFLAVVAMGGSAVIGIVLAVAAFGVRGKGVRVPFGPSMVIGCLSVIAFAAPILDPLVPS